MTITFQEQGSKLSDLEAESIAYFVSLVQLLGLPKSIGQIYGLLFVADHPMAMDEIIDRLQISKGCVSQGLTTLKSLGVITTETIQNERREFFTANMEVTRMIRHFFEEQLEPRLLRSEEQLKNMVNLAIEESRGERMMGRLEMLDAWQRHSRRTLPMLKKFLNE